MGFKSFFCSSWTYFLISNIAMAAFRAGHGMITAEVLEMTAIGIPAVLLGLLAGSKVFERLNSDSLKKAIYIFLALAGVAALLS